MKWFDRDFPGGVPLWMYRPSVERVRGTPARLGERLQGVPCDLLTRRDGLKWSIQENAGHLLDLESLWADRLEDYARGREILTAADVENRKTHLANHNMVPLEQILGPFRSARSALVARLDRYDESFISRTALHPRLRTPMRVIDLVFFVAEHDDHHLARITESIHIYTEGGSGLV